MAKEFESTNTKPLTKADIQAAAKELGCEPAIVQAVTLVEAPRGGFIPAPDNRPVILFESHQFHKFTNGKYDHSHPNISTASWVANYGATGKHQYDRLYEAININLKDPAIRTAALKSASWGKFQICGFNFSNAGCDTLEEFIEASVDSEASQLDLFISFVVNTGCDQYLINKDWSSFALHYNGVGQVEYYAGILKSNYQKAVAQGYNK